MMKTFIASPFVPELLLFLVLICVSAFMSFAAAVVLAASLDLCISLFARQQTRRKTLTSGQD